MKWPNPSLPATISAATSTDQVMPIPTLIPTKIEGSAPGKMIRRKTVAGPAPSERAART